MNAIIKIFFVPCRDRAGAAQDRGKTGDSQRGGGTLPHTPTGDHADVSADFYTQGNKPKAKRD